MNSKRQSTIAATLAVMLLKSLVVLAQTPPKHVPAKAPPAHPLVSQTASSAVLNSTLRAAPPRRPNVLTAPRPVVGGNEKAIIFVGGKTALNPQPIPPGRTAPGNPVH